MKKHLIWAAASAALLASCAKEETQTFTPAATDLPQASITFVAEENADFTRAFFDNTTTTEAWEQSLSSLTVFCFEEGALVMRRNFTSAELSSRRSTFALPRSTAGKSIEFYALANAAVDENITTKTALLALTEETPGSYNGTFANVSSKALRNNRKTFATRQAAQNLRSVLTDGGVTIDELPTVIQGVNTLLKVLGESSIPLLPS